MSQDSTGDRIGEAQIVIQHATFSEPLRLINVNKAPTDHPAPSTADENTTPSSHVQTNSAVGTTNQPAPSTAQEGHVSPNPVYTTSAVSTTNQTTTSTKSTALVSTGILGPTADAEYTQKFTLFPTLALELRRMVWKRALPGPRLVSIRQRELKKEIWEWEAEQGRTWPITLREMQDLSLAEDTTPQSDKLQSGHDAANKETVHNMLALGKNKPCAPRPKPEAYVRLVNVAEMQKAMAEVLTWDAHEHDPDAYRGNGLVGYCPSHLPPNILYVCRESHNVVMDHYHRAFSSISAVPQTFIDFNIDALYLRPHNFSCYFAYDPKNKNTLFGEM
ncbi:hypothetical protein DL98DRAFT_73145 [Cadophora sp. DSE1049]|nr:hypothetical protein DL98DRAFT_73145 [Cadophora sp. DSE1049]